MKTSTAIRYYGRRKGKPLKAGRQSLLETVLPEIRITLSENACNLDPRRFFSAEPKATSLEIGFGSGEHLAAKAAANPEDGFIGCEVFLNGVASLTRHVDAQGLANVRIFDEDAHYLLPVLQAASLSHVFLLFPDPWPKSRHAKRRFISPQMLSELARVLVDGGELRVASDHPIYVRWALLHATEHPEFEWTAKGPESWCERPADSVATRYEEKARQDGRSPVFLSFKRRPRSSPCYAKTSCPAP
jgi:tRNA (guanine-N7-)-methyltransferase